MRKSARKLAEAVAPLIAMTIEAVKPLIVRVGTAIGSRHERRRKA